MLRGIPSVAAMTVCLTVRHSTTVANSINIFFIDLITLIF